MLCLYEQFDTCSHVSILYVWLVVTDLKSWTSPMHTLSATSEGYRAEYAKLVDAERHQSLSLFQSSKLRRVPLSLPALQMPYG